MSVIILPKRVNGPTGMTSFPIPSAGIIPNFSVDLIAAAIFVVSMDVSSVE
jgi:hypothetical protein